MSNQSEHIYLLLKSTFPYCNIIKEYSVKYQNQQLYFDIYLKEYNLLFEIQGRQHSEFVSHFHGDKQGYIASKKRDNLKIAYCEENNLTLIAINYDEVINTKEDILKKINEAIG